MFTVYYTRVGDTKWTSGPSKFITGKAFETIDKANRFAQRVSRMANGAYHVVRVVEEAHW